MTSRNGRCQVLGIRCQGSGLGAREWGRAQRRFLTRDTLYVVLVLPACHSSLVTRHCLWEAL